MWQLKFIIFCQKSVFVMLYKCYRITCNEYATLRNGLGSRAPPIKLGYTPESHFVSFSIFIIVHNLVRIAKWSSMLKKLEL